MNRNRPLDILARSYHRNN